MTHLTPLRDIFDQMCDDYEQKLGVPLLHNGEADRADIKKMCVKYNKNYPLVRAMWNHYLDDEREGRFGYTLDNFMTTRRLSIFAVKAHQVMHQHDKVVEEICYLYRCVRCGGEGNEYTPDKRESLATPCRRRDCRGRMVYDRVMGE